MDLDYIRENYKKFTDDKIESLAKSDVRKLRPEVIPILIEEIKSRGLAESLLAGIEAQTKTYKPEELDAYYNFVQNQPCPVCHSRDKNLNALLLTEVLSIILITRTTLHLKIACHGCLEKLANTSNFKTATLGWWGFPIGIIKTISALIANSKMRKNIISDEPNAIFKSFVNEHIGVIETNKREGKGLEQLFTRANQID